MGKINLDVEFGFQDGDCEMRAVVMLTQISAAKVSQTEIVGQSVITRVSLRMYRMVEASRVKMRELTESGLQQNWSGKLGFCVQGK
jgi:uncharacterized Rossmann fold enzyme